MAALHTPPISDATPVKEAVVILAETGYPVTASQLSKWLVRAGVARERIDRTDYYSMSEIFELHRDKIDQGILRN